MSIHRLFAGSCACLASIAASAAEVPVYEARVKGLGAFELTLAESDFKPRVSIGWERDGGTQYDEHSPVSYAHRVKLTKSGQTDKLPPKTAYSNCVVSIASREMRFASGKWTDALGGSLTYYQYPRFSMSKGLYGHQDVLRLMPEWKRLLKTGADCAYDFRFVPEGTNTLVYLNGSLAGLIPGAKGVVGLTPVAGRRTKTTVEVLRQGASARRASALHELDPIPLRANALLAKDAKLSVGTGPQTLGGVPITVWDPSVSIDQGRHRKTANIRDLVWDPMMEERTPWSVGFEYFQWRVPGRHWLYAWILCADIPQAGKAPVVGTQLCRFGRGCTSGNIDFATTSLDGAATNANIRKVGTLSYAGEGGRRVETPLYLVRQRLDYAKLGVRGQDQFAVDFEFVGAGTWDGFPRSSVQIFGCSLEEAPFDFKANNPIRGNLFEMRDDKRAGFDLTANRAGVKGYCTYEIYGPLYEPVKKGRFDFTLGAAGETTHQTLDLNGYGVGWYGLDLAFFTADGTPVVEHKAAFTVLADDDREAGYESPYAAWPLTGGYHNSNPNPEEQLEVMRKAGYRKTWRPPLTNELLCAKWKVTRSSTGFGYHNCGHPMKTRAEFDRHLDGAVELVRDELAAFPHCKVFQLLHETGGKQISDEVKGARPAVRGKYLGWNFEQPSTNGIEWMVFYCTEMCQRLHQEFPDLKIMIGNGSSSCQRISELVRNGFDLALADQLGIESKGFGTLPEFYCNQEAPGMLWTLRETGRVFGYTNFTLNACNEYVFRPERAGHVAREKGPRRIMQVTDYTLRDYLLSLAHGCDIISTGHLEDCNDAYYDTNWGAGGQCTFYPYSYPKRMYTALAVLTRALDCPKYLRRVPTGANTAYALEFRRDRRVKDYAYALWTPRYGATLALRFPRGVEPTLVETFGRELKLKVDAKGEVTVKIGSSPCYVLSEKPAEAARVVAFDAPETPAGTVELAALDAEAVTVSPDPSGSFGSYYGDVQPAVGTFKLATVADPERKQPVLDLTLVPQKGIPDVIWEFTQLDLRKPVLVDARAYEKVGLLVRGNGAFTQIMLKCRAPGGRKASVLKFEQDRSFVTFDGWQLLTAELPKERTKSRKDPNRKPQSVEVVSVVCGSAQKALDPIEMAPVTANLRLGAIVGVRRADAKAVDAGEGQARDTMKHVDEKDL